MAHDLTASHNDRQNVLNNRYACQKVQDHLALPGIQYAGEVIFTKHQLATIFSVSESTIEKYLSAYGDELKANGYTVLKGKKLKEFKDLVGDTITNYGTLSQLGVFSFRATLNFAMLLTESDAARVMRSRILDIVIDVMAERSGGHTKYINQRDREYLPAAYQEFNYRKMFTEALSNYLEMGPMKFGVYTNKIYQLVFRENASEYKRILKLATNDNLRDTLYSEVLKAIASIENGLAYEMKEKFGSLGRKLLPAEVDAMLEGAERNPYLKPIIEDARTKMASRDKGFRDALHEKLEAYIQTVPEGDFERFLGEASKSLEQQLADPETLEVFKRLKDR